MAQNFANNQLLHTNSTPVMMQSPMTETVKEREDVAKDLLHNHIKRLEFIP